MPGINSASSLLERLTASSNQANQSSGQITSPPPANVNLQGINLTSLPNSINGLQNVQVLPAIDNLQNNISLDLNLFILYSRVSSKLTFYN